MNRDYIPGLFALLIVAIGVFLRWRGLPISPFFLWAPLAIAVGMILGAMCARRG